MRREPELDLGAALEERLLSLALALPPPRENRATTGTLSPLNTAALDSERPTVLPTK